MVRNNKDPLDYKMADPVYLGEIRALAKRNPIGFQILVLLMERINCLDAVVVSQATMCQILGYGRTAVYNAVRLLEAEKWLQIIKVGTATGYVINSKVVWTGQKEKRFSSFQAEILISEAEQTQSIEEWDNLELRHIPKFQAVEDPILASAAAKLAKAIISKS